MGFMKYKGYTGSVEFSDEDNCLFGKVQGLHGTLISYEGMTIDEIRKDFEGAIDDYLASCHERDIKPVKPYSGRFVVRMTSDLHGRLAALADATGTTINDIINSAVKKEVEHYISSI